MAVRTILVPDLDDEITHALAELEELLLTYRGWEEVDGLDPGELPDPLAAGIALASVRSLWEVLGPTQGRQAVDHGRSARLLAPNGRYEHAPVRLVDVAVADVLVMAGLARMLADPAAPAIVHDGLEDGRATTGATLIR
ncbi:hypothetical protein [Nonomuraea sp. NPDC050310]|uniref:hypothetical protein n=1 Tax=Nonomuraea sp. NPDC050310 TaxID=3154935 RepID=UPI0033CF6CF8